MKLKALSHYNGDVDTRFGDCVLLYDSTSLVVYDCGHARHAQEVEDFLCKNALISKVHIVISHNDSDHTDGIEKLMEYLHSKKYDVTVYSSLYLKSARKVLELLDDGRRTLPATKQHILETFDNIKKIVEKAQAYGFSIENAETVLLCGDASPDYLHHLDNYDLIQLPHHGKLDNAMNIFEALKDSYSKDYLISDNTGSGATSGGSDKLVEYMKNEHYSPAFNTKNGVVSIPRSTYGNVSNTRTQGVKLGEMDCKF